MQGEFYPLIRRFCQKERKDGFQSLEKYYRNRKGSPQAFQKKETAPVFSAEAERFPIEEEGFLKWQPYPFPLIGII